MKRSCLKSVFLVLLLSVILVGCGGNKKSDNYHTFDGFALGTTYRIIVDTKDATDLRQAIDSLYRETNGSMSLHDPNSLLSRVNRDETDSLDHHIAYCIELAQRVSEMSQGSYDITVEPLTEAWGFVTKEPTERPNVDSLLQFVGYRKISVVEGRLLKERKGVKLDLNSIAKGYIVDLMGRMLEEKGVVNYMVEIGGEIFCRGENSRGKKWTIGVDKPLDNNVVPGAELQVKVGLSDRGLATSGNYRKFYHNAQGQKIVHTIDPISGIPTQSNLLSATVVAENCATADAIGTMLMAVGLERAKDFLDNNPHYLGYLIYSDESDRYETYQSAGFEKMIVE